jgi:L-ascorbate metabolism protein UlaG (beta-lactamase superfamily)
MPTTLERIVHASVLLRFEQAAFLTDPWFSERPLYHQGEPRSIASPADLPRLSAILVSHHHYDHCDLDAMQAYPYRDVPWIVNPGTGERVRKAGFPHVIELAPWQSTSVDGVQITAAPGSHGVPEVTYVLQSGDRTVYFGGDTRRIPELDEIAARFPSIDLALLPINGLRSRPQGNRQEVMDAQQAADLAAVLRPRIAVPIHYAYTAGPIGDRLLLSIVRNRPDLFRDAAAITAPDTDVRILPTGDVVAI